MATYRNSYENFYTEKQGSYVAIGAIVPVLANQWTTDKTETGYTAPPNQSVQDPHFCHRGYLYCDGEEYDINAYPNLYDKIQNTYNDSSDSNFGDLITNKEKHYINFHILNFSICG